MGALNHNHRREFERVSDLNTWNSQDKLRHVYFPLEDAAKAWCEIRETILTMWDLFRINFLETFARVVQIARAVRLMEARPQLPKETITIITEEMTCPFWEAKPEMPEEKKVRFLMWGVKQELFARLIPNPAKGIVELFPQR